jgi:hypothetical protein
MDELSYGSTYGNCVTFKKLKGEKISIEVFTQKMSSSGVPKVTNKISTIIHRKEIINWLNSFDKKPKKKEPYFKLVVVDDYHEIDPPKGWKAIELGCWPPKQDNYCKYFGIYYKDRKPSLERVFKRVCRKINFGQVEHCYTGEDVSVNKEEVFEECKQVLKGT